MPIEGSTFGGFLADSFRMRILLKPTLYRMLAMIATAILIPEAILFLFLSVRRFLLFRESVRSPEPPDWHYLLFSFTMLAAVFFCLSGCRLVWQRVDEECQKVINPDHSGRQRGRPSRKEVGLRLGLTFTFFLFAYLIPLVLYGVGKVLGKEDMMEWIVGIPIGLAFLSYLVLFILRRRAMKR